MVLEEWLRLMLFCGMPPLDVNLIHGVGSGMSRLVHDSCNSKTMRAMQFTGSNHVAKTLCVATEGKVRIEDAGFNWKVFGRDVGEVDFVAFTCDQDAHANTGQKCSATSLLFLHENWMRSPNSEEKQCPGSTTCDLLARLKVLASKRNLSELTIAPVLTLTTEDILNHVEKILKNVAGSRLLWGGKELEGHSIPKCYGAVEATAVFVPLSEFLGKNFELITREIFGPFQIVTSWRDEEKDLPLLIKILEKMENHLTGAICSNNVLFQQKLLASSVNGTTYCGIRGRTTGAPQNHWFGPGGDPRAAGIGSPEAIKLVWSGHREVIMDVGPVKKNMEMKQS